MISKINRRNTKLIERVLYRLCACENCIKYIIAGRINKNTNKEILFAWGHNFKTKKSRNRQSEIGKTYIGLNNPFYNKKHTKESRNKMSSSGKRRKVHGMRGKCHTEKSIEIIKEKRKIQKMFPCTEQKKKKISESEKGKIISNEQKEKNSIASKKNWQDLEWRINQIKVLTIARNRPEVKERQSKSLKIKWRNPEFIENQRIARNLHPNKQESFWRSVLPERYPMLGWEYTGDFTFWINCKNPDFVSKKYKLIIEYNGGYFHQNDVPGQREAIFAEWGWKTFIIWDYDMLDMEKLYKRLDEFCVIE